MRFFQIILVALLGLSLFMVQPCQADDLSSVVNNIGLSLQREADIPDPQLIDLVVDESILELEALIEPVIGSTEETLQLLMAFGIIERENYWLGCKLEK
ncbi:MAG: hypothetical protein US57_C0009G0041 [Candidatus Moranbacteria bacterium GW2011_GWC2_37_73]|nr:MAG: hypothetical protein UR95_C0005G0001 [Parcubacteria group bacterium GW2011_GWC1_36_108]KKQ00955.1 MAG: hypothetical protein US09_C0004G0018 [Candidatus Moranbacteria bacterium GW2011_GWD1_36_198]KKQ01426.1 MAG: hypothetical protein US10_C0013G0001 [Candidatus Moranbacteria bacterium GW2011_GWD2_36_198]KKQ39797.1 MAG: hypothetical protein US57_C0009G0041 [Candidatus Moranbacteria bacterium GW2011_GWC2_37_73]HBU10985.1 hypothetical protein [Candidatus Moranbacteria bacterium]